VGGTPRRRREQAGGPIVQQLALPVLAGPLSFEQLALPVVAGPLSFDPIAEARRQWDLHWGPEATASMAAVTSIMRAQQIVMARLNELLGPLGLTFPRYEALMLLFYSRRGELPLGKMSDRLQVHPASVTNAIDKLAEVGYAERVGHQRDRRAVLARITPEGRRAARQATGRLNAAAFGTEPLDEQACETLYATLLPLRVAAGDFVTPTGPGGGR
jgi:DNA-binding MarR family transcriptional regulator